MNQDAPEAVLSYLSAPGPMSPTTAATPLITVRALATVACKLMAVWMMAGTAAATIGFACQAIEATFGVASRRLDLVDLFSVARAALVVAGPIVAGVCLWRLADRLATWIVSADAAVPTGGVGYAGLLSIGLAMAGVVVGTQAVRDAVGLVAYMMVKHPDGSWRHNDYFVHNLASAIAGVALAAWLIFGSRGIAQLVAMARSAGSRGPDQPVP